MIEWVRFNVRLDTPNKDGVTNRAVFEKARERGMKAPLLDEEPDFPEEFIGLYKVFAEVCVGVATFTPLSYTELKNYCDLMDEDLTPVDIDVLMRMDRAAINEAMKHQQRQG